MPDNNYTQKLTEDVVRQDINDLQNFIGVLGNMAEHYNTNNRKQKDAKNQEICANNYQLLDCAKKMLSSAKRDIERLNLGAL